MLPLEPYDRNGLAGGPTQKLAYPKQTHKIKTKTTTTTTKYTAITTKSHTNKI